ncbi:putative nuclease HARBI1 isoform X2 [Tanacetum coccineum]
MSSDLFFYTSSDDEDEVNSELAAFTEACQAVYDAAKPKVLGKPWMSQRLFTKIVQEVTDASYFFQERYDCTGHRSISALIKCTSAVRELAYGCVPDSLDEYLQMGATTSRDSFRIFCKVIMNLYGEELLRKPTYTDIEKLYAYHNENHGFLGMLGSIDCTNWSWANCPVAFKAQFSRGDHRPDPFILLEAIASNDLWIWHAFFGVSGMNNDVNHEAARKDVERAFGVLKQKWKIIKYPARGMTRSGLSDIMYTCLILHNMIIHDNGNAISPEFFPEEQHRDDDPVRTHQESMQVTQEIIDKIAHLSLKADLVEHLWNNAN